MTTPSGGAPAVHLQSTRAAFAAALLAAAAGCSTMTIQPETGVTVRDTPSFQETRDFFLWGLVGEHRLNVTEVCAEQDVAQMQSQATFTNGLVSALTLGIYAPHSVRVWCEDTVLNVGAL